jgi:hypothetical protein
LRYTVHDANKDHVFVDESWLDGVARGALGMIAIDGGLADFEQVHHGARGYRRVYEHPSGLSIAAEPYYGRHCSVTFPGHISVSIIPDIAKSYFDELALRGVHLNITRLDLASDTDEFAPQDLFAAWLSGKVSCNSERSTLGRYFHPLAEHDDTVSFGARTSERYGRCYLHENGHTRIEVEFKGVQAFGIWFQLLRTAEEAWGQCIVGAIREFVEFDIDAWRSWACGALAAKFEIVPRRVSRSLMRTFKWFEKNIVTSLALVREVVGAEGLENLIADGLNRMTERQRLMLADFQAGGFNMRPSFGSG